jgi:1-acyl-sn-glycerol-3-phosphate acyltransferase
MRRLVAALLIGDLRRAFRQVIWVGPVPDLPTQPVVAVANHHSYFDGHLLWLLARAQLGRPFAVWMEELDRFPFLALQGALPFPAGSAARRVRTVRHTRRLLGTRPDTVLAYFPEGTLHGPEDPVWGWPDDTLPRLHAVLGEPVWWPVGIHVTWRGQARPTALMTGEAWHREPRGDEAATLERLRRRLRAPRDPERVLLEGVASPAERWQFGWMRPLFRGLRTGHTLR